MIIRAKRVSLAFAAFALLLMLGSQTALADTELGDHGKVGVHSLTDSSSTPGAKCTYKVGATFTKLKSITVRPPNMAASPGRTSQIIGWRFVIERRFNGSTLGPWKQIYRSPLQTTSIGGEGSGFSSMSAAITLPPNEGITGEHEFRVVVKMVWLGKDDQTVVGSSRHRVDFYRVVTTAGGHSTTQASCGALLGP